MLETVHGTVRRLSKISNSAFEWRLSKSQIAPLNAITIIIIIIITEKQQLTLITKNTQNFEGICLPSAQVSQKSRDEILRGMLTLHELVPLLSSVGTSCWQGFYKHIPKSLADFLFASSCTRFKSALLVCNSHTFIQYDHLL